MKKESAKKLVMFFTAIALTVPAWNYFTPVANAAGLTTTTTNPTYGMGGGSNYPEEVVTDVDDGKKDFGEFEGEIIPPPVIMPPPPKDDNQGDKEEEGDEPEVIPPPVIMPPPPKGDNTGNIEKEDASKAINTGSVKGKSLSDTMNVEPLSGSLKKLKLNKGSAEILVPGN